METFRGMLVGATNKLEKLPPAHDSTSRGGGLGGGGGQNFGPSFGGGGMDPWQSSVEGRLGRLEDRLSKVDTSLATLTERVTHLPTENKLYGTAVAIVLALTAVMTFGEKLQSLVAPSEPNVSEARQGAQGPESNQAASAAVRR